MENNKLSDDYCDLYGNKICDNCGKCLEIDGVDIKAINIEEISKTVEENEFLEEELKRAISQLHDEKEAEEVLESEDDYNFDMQSNNDEYIDAFDHIVYLDEIGIEDDESINEMTEEIYPGILKLKKEY